jgi:hypothetical protein
VVAVLDGDGDRRPDGLTSADAADELAPVLLDLHARASAIPAPTSGQVGVDIGRDQLETGGHAVDDHGKPRSM